MNRAEARDFLEDGGVLACPRCGGQIALEMGPWKMLWLHGVICRLFIRDDVAMAWVLNHTNRWFSVGFTTSPTTNGHILGLLVTDDAAKRQDQEDGEHYKKFNGVMTQLALWWFKLYFYVYFDGDGNH